MTAVLNNLLPTKLALVRRRGWIGVDIGARSIKLAQIERTAAGWRLAGRWTIGDDDSSPLTRDLLLAGRLGQQNEAIKSARRMFRGRTAAVTLPTSLVELRSFELPTAPWDELRAMVGQELAAEPPTGDAEDDFDAWPAAESANQTRVIAVAAEREVSLRTANDLLHAGLHCRAIDVAPCALARAVDMCDPESRERPVIALDLGFAATTLTVVREGRSLFCRMLRGCGLQSLLQQLHEKLGLSTVECRQLLVRYGVASDARAEPAAAATQQIINRALEQLAEETRRTLQFADQQLRSSHARMWLFGGGAAIRNLPGYLAARTGLPTAAWRLSSAGDSLDPLYGVAAGLSALAWEPA